MSAMPEEIPTPLTDAAAGYVDADDGDFRVSADFREYVPYVVARDLERSLTTAAGLIRLLLESTGPCARPQRGCLCRFCAASNFLKTIESK